MMKRGLILSVIWGAAAGGCGTTDSKPTPPLSTLTFQLRNDSASSVYLFEACIVDYTITALADPAHAITRVDGCTCECNPSGCGICGECPQDAVEVAAGATQNESWTAVDLKVESTPSGSCYRQQTLPPGPYRIDVPVYATAVDAAGGATRTGARMASQTFTLPVPGDAVAVELGVAP